MFEQFLRLFPWLNLLVVVGLARVFFRAGVRWWWALVPIYNLVVLLRITGKPSRWFAQLMLLTLLSMVLATIYSLIPDSIWKSVAYVIAMAALIFTAVFNVYVGINISLGLATCFGRGVIFGLGVCLFPFIGLPWLGFSKRGYLSPSLAQQLARDRERLASLGVAILENYRNEGRTVLFGRGSQITDAEIRSIGSEPFDEVYLSRTRITDQSIDWLLKIARPKVLDVSNSDISAEGVRRLKTTMIETQVIG